MLTGIDISSWQPQTIWPQIATGVDFAIAKTTENIDYTNPFYAGQIDGARQNDVLVGHYHYARPGTSPLLSQVGHFLRQLTRRDGEPVSLDLEEGDGNLADWANDFMLAVAEALHIDPLLYTYPFFADQHGLHDPRLARFRLWYAFYPNSGKPDTAWPSVAPWGKATIWQYTANGRVPGIDKVVDLNVFDGTRDDFRALGTGGLGRIEPDANKLSAWFANHRRVT